MSIFISFSIFQYSFYYSFTLYYCAIFNSLDAGLFSIPSGCQAFWIQSRPDKLFAKVINRRQKTKLLLADKELNTEQLVDTTLWLKSWLKSISFASNFFHLAKEIEKERAGCFALFVFLMSRDCCVALPHGAIGFSAVCDCGIS